MSKPTTKGGFSNDGSKIMTQSKSSENSANLCTVTFTTTPSVASKYRYDVAVETNSNTDQGNLVENTVELTISTTLYSSNLSLDDFYTIDSMSQFITTEKQKRVDLIQTYQADKAKTNKKTTPKPITKIAIQSPDELLVDCSLIIAALKSQRHGHNDISFYILGDTSYSSCCVDRVAAEHIQADLIIHIGFACMSQVETIPVFYAFGVLSLTDQDCVPQEAKVCFNKLKGNQNGQEDQKSWLSEANSTSLYRFFSPLLSILFKICATSAPYGDIDYSPGYDDYDEYPDELIYGGETEGADGTPVVWDALTEKYRYLMVLDQRYSANATLLRAALQILGFETTGCQENYWQEQKERKGADGLILKALEPFLQEHIAPYLDSNTTTHPLYRSRSKITLVFASPSNHSQADKVKTDHFSITEHTNKASPPPQPQLNSFQGLFTFAGYTFPVSIPGFDPEDGKAFSVPPVLAGLSTRQLWSRFFHPSQWKICFVSNHIPFQTPAALLQLQESNSSALDFKTIPDPASATFLTHLAMNFTQHSVLDCFPYFRLPFTATESTITKEEGSPDAIQSLIHLLTKTGANQLNLSSETPTQYQSLSSITPAQLNFLSTMEQFSPSSEQSRVLSQRFYLVEKCKNARTIGIVAGTLSNQSTLLTIERLKKLCEMNDIKHYTIVIGKLNEAKLLNFGDISMFVVVTCPLSVIFRFHNRHGQLHATTIDQWSLQQRLAGSRAGMVNQGKNQGGEGMAESSGGNAPATISSMVDIVTPFECELALNSSEFSWNGSYTTHFSDVLANVGRFGLLKDKINKDDLDFVQVEMEKKKNQQHDPENNEKTNQNDQNGADVPAQRSTKQNVRPVDQDELDGVRYSSIDGKYHQIVKKGTNLNGTDDSETSTSLIEQTFGLIDPTTNKQLIYVKNHATGQVTIKEREFTGLAQHFDLEEANMLIQPGLHGNSEGYISIADQGKPGVEKTKH